jgi:KEOPS complex subunit Pcc1
LRRNGSLFSRTFFISLLVQVPVLIMTGRSMPHTAVFRIRTEHAPAILKAILPELADEVNPRSVTACELEGDDVLIIRVGAQDTAALRAALNMVLRLVNVADEMQELV